jgi:hypothetical protein
VKKTIALSAFALTVLASGAAFATGNGAHMRDEFGPVYTMQAGGHEMHVQAIKDNNGGEWVIMSREDAEAMMGHKFDGGVVFRLYETKSQ